MSVIDFGGSVHFWFESELINHVGHVVIYNTSESEVDIAHQSCNKITFKIFDLVLRNSVLDHVSPEGRVQVAREIVRVGKHGFIQTPALEFPVEPHFVLPFIHSLPRAICRYFVRVSPWALLSERSPDAQDTYFAEIGLLSKCAVRQLFPPSLIHAERSIGLPKPWLATW
jgi:hypothetical protein